jgi:hypothetical protein
MIAAGKIDRPQAPVIAANRTSAEIIGRTRKADAIHELNSGVFTLIYKLIHLNLLK